jgi:UDP-N-acetylglucosamine--N-acetylmuramyl-(pentapeptide) pyrophosphoryl-undecaprenol N-acetylglucosamine transferase
VSELSALGIPAVYVPYPVGNGEQRFNAAGVVEAGGAVLVDDAEFTPEWVLTSVVPLLSDDARLRGMSQAAARVGVRDGAQRMVELIREAHQSASRAGRGGRSGR